MTVDERVERARCGDPGAWTELYEATTGRLLVWLRTRPSGDAAVAPEDIVAEAWLVAAQSIADFSGDSDAFAGWMFGIARNIARNTRRRSIRRATDPTHTITDSVTGTMTDTFTDDIATSDEVRRILAGLSPREADVLAAMEVAGLDTKQTAAALGVSVSAVRVARHRGLIRLRRSAQPQRAFNPA